MRLVNRMLSAIDSGYQLSDVIRAELGESVGHWASRRGFVRTSVSMCINGYRGRFYPEIREALAEDLGIEASDIHTLIEHHKASKEGR